VEGSLRAKNQLDSSSRFDTIPACDGQTDRRTQDDSKYGASIASRAKSGGAGGQAACVAVYFLSQRNENPHNNQLPHSFNNTRARHRSVPRARPSTALWYAFMTTVGLRRVQRAIEMFRVTVSTIKCRFVLAIRQTAWTAMRSPQCATQNRQLTRAMCCPVSTKIACGCVHRTTELALVYTSHI